MAQYGRSAAAAAIRTGAAAATDSVCPHRPSNVAQIPLTHTVSGRQGRKQGLGRTGRLAGGGALVHLSVARDVSLQFGLLCKHVCNDRLLESDFPLGLRQRFVAVRPSAAAARHGSHHHRRRSALGDAQLVHLPIRYAPHQPSAKVHP
jgi:hypothetical protein